MDDALVRVLRVRVINRIFNLIALFDCCGLLCSFLTCPLPASTGRCEVVVLY